MTITNYILIIVGVFVALLGILSIFFPGLTRVINAPGGARVRSIIAIVIGLIILMIGSIVELPSN